MSEAVYRIDQGDFTAAVIIPVYNVEAYLPRCMDSVLSQTVAFNEIILVDDGSTDESGSICDKYAKMYDNVRVYHKENGGLSSARNAGIKISTSRYLSFIDSDDWVAPNYLEVLLRLIKDFQADIAMCDMKRVSSNEVEQNSPMIETENEVVYSQDEFMRIMLRIDGNRTVHYAPAKLYERSVLDENQFPLGYLNEDVESCFKAILRSRSIAETNHPLYFYYINSESITESKFGENYLNLTEVWSRILSLSERIAPQWNNAVDYNLKRADFTILCDALVHGDSTTDTIYKEELKSHLKRLRRNYFNLMKGFMRTDRKVLLTLVAFGYPVVKPVIRIGRSVLGR